GSPHAGPGTAFLRVATRTSWRHSAGSNPPLIVLRTAGLQGTAGFYPREPVLLRATHALTDARERVSFEGRHVGFRCEWPNPRIARRAACREAAFIIARLRKRHKLLANIADYCRHADCFEERDLGPVATCIGREAVSGVSVFFLCRFSRLIQVSTL